MTTIIKITSQLFWMKYRSRYKKYNNNYKTNCYYNLMYIRTTIESKKAKKENKQKKFSEDKNSFKINSFLQCQK